MERISNSNFIIISGSGKKVGKTFLAVALIRHFSHQSPIIALKISPHRHDKLGSVDAISITDRYRLFRESEAHEKNSGQFLKAGAMVSCFLETEDDFLQEAITEFSGKCNPMNLPVICESGALGTILKPGVMVYLADPLKQDSPYKESQRNLADMVLPARQYSPSDTISKIQLIGSKWIMELK